MKPILLVWLLLMVSLLPSLLWSQAAILSSRKAPADFELTADPSAAEWCSIERIVMESDYFGSRVPNHRTEVRSRWTRSHLYLLYVCQYEELNLKPEPVTTTETPRLWNWDVAEAFIGSDFSDIGRYKEFQVSPQGEWVDLGIGRSKGQGKARIDSSGPDSFGSRALIPARKKYPGRSPGEHFTSRKSSASRDWWNRNCHV